MEEKDLELGDQAMLDENIEDFTNENVESEYVETTEDETEPEYVDAVDGEVESEYVETTEDGTESEYVDAVDGEVEPEYVEATEDEAESKSEETSETVAEIVYSEEAEVEMESEQVNESEPLNKKGKVKKTKKIKKVNGAVKGTKKMPKFVESIQGSIKYKMIGAFLIPVVLIILLGIVSFSVASSAITSSFKDSAESTINKTADYYTLMFDNIDSTAVDIMNNQTLQRYYSGFYSSDMITEGENYSSLKSSISSSVMSDDSISDIYIFGSYGKSIVTGSSKIGENDDYAKMAASEEGKQIDKKNKSNWFTSTDYLETVNIKNYGLLYGRQLIGVNKKGVGYIFLEISKKYVSSPIEDIDLGVDSMMGLIAPDGGEIITSNYQDIDETKSYFTGQEFMSKIPEDQEQGSMYVKYNGKKQLFIYAKLDSGFTVVAMVPESEIVAKANSIGIVSITIVVIAIVIALLIGGFFATNMSKAISAMMKNLEKAASGDLTVDMNIIRKDEFATLANSTQGMIDNFKGLIQQTKNVSATVDQSSETVTESSKQMLSETKEITMAIQEIERGVVQQAEDSEDCLRQMDDLSDKINIVSENSGKIEQIAEETNEIVTSGISSIEELKADAESTVAITHQVIEEILELKDSSKSIGNIIGAINEIASQTNLLSLNASIEAARAGEAGRGFAVVASEIRKLADQSVNFANEIQKIVEGINSKTNDTVRIAQKAEDVVAVQGKSLDNAAQVFTDIQSQFNELLGNLEGITVQIEQIADSKAKTIDAISSISAVSQQTAAASEEVAETANRQVEAMEKLSQAADNLEDNSAHLREAIDVFRV